MPPRVPPKASNKAPSKGKEERMQGILNYRNIYLKIFGETAMADMEVVFPEKKVWRGESAALTFCFSPGRREAWALKGAVRICFSSRPALG